MTGPDPLGGLGGPHGPQGAPGPDHQHDPQQHPAQQEPHGAHDHSHGPRESLAVRFHKVRRVAPSTLGLSLVLGLAFLLQSWAGGWVTDDPLALYRLGALHWPSVLGGDWWRLGSYAFLHVGPAHFLLNMWALWIFMRPIEGLFGPAGALGMFAASALAGGAASAFWAWHGGNPYVVAAGASGGIAGLFGARIGLLARLRHRLPPEALRAELQALLINLVLNGLLAYQAATGGIPLDNAAHLGGLTAGAVLALGAPIPALGTRLHQRLTGGLLIGCAFALAAMEGAAAARAVRPRTRTLNGPGVTAQAPWMLPALPDEPGQADGPGGIDLQARISRDRLPLELPEGGEALRLGDRTWLRLRLEGKDERHSYVVLIAQEGAGRLIVSVKCGGGLCGKVADEAAAQLATSFRTLPTAQQ